MSCACVFTGLRLVSRRGALGAPRVALGCNHASSRGRRWVARRKGRGSRAGVVAGQLVTEKGVRASFLTSHKSSSPPLVPYVESKLALGFLGPRRPVKGSTRAVRPAKAKRQKTKTLYWKT